MIDRLLGIESAEAQDRCRSGSAWSSAEVGYAFYSGRSAAAARRVKWSPATKSHAGQ